MIPNTHGGLIIQRILLKAEGSEPTFTACYKAHTLALAMSAHTH